MEVVFLINESYYKLSKIDRDEMAFERAQGEFSVFSQLRHEQKVKDMRKHSAFARKFTPLFLPNEEQYA